MLGRVTLNDQRKSYCVVRREYQPKERGNMGRRFLYPSNGNISDKSGNGRGACYQSGRILGNFVKRPGANLDKIEVDSETRDEVTPV
jgi:hypothetical protein